MAHTFKTTEDINTWIRGILATMGPKFLRNEVADMLSTTPLQVQPDPVGTDKSVEVAPLAWRDFAAALQAASRDPRHPAHEPAKVSPLVAGVEQLLRLRYLQGVVKYGTPLHTHNGRNAYADTFQELIDAVIYLSQAKQEDHDVTHLDLCAQLAFDHVVAALLYVAALVDSDAAGHLVGRERKRIPREAIEAYEAVEPEAVPVLVTVDSYEGPGSIEVDHVAVAETIAENIREAGAADRRDDGEEWTARADETRREVEAAVEEDGGEVRGT